MHELALLLERFWATVWRGWCSSDVGFESGRNMDWFALV
jgi:hypothetical protein